jgi:basic amino acid/polyamine antiporter, APA family
MNSPSSSGNESGSPQLIRGMGLGSAVAVNMLDMIGVGPFITLPLIVGAMGGPQAILGWVIGAFLAICDGLVWAELGAAMPEAGGSYRYLMEIYGPKKLGRLISFLFIWQLTFSAPLSIASGCIGMAQYAGYLMPSLQHSLAEHTARVNIPLLGPVEANLVFSLGTLLAIATCVVAVFLLYRKITAIGKLSRFLWVGVVATLGWIIVAGITHFNWHQAFAFPPGAFHLTHAFSTGLGSAVLIATYDYWGAYNICFLGSEVKDPEKTVPRAVLLSIVAVAVIYIVMNISVLGVIPWQELSANAASSTRFYVISVFMQRIYGAWAGKVVTVLIMWTAFASVFSLLLGYSRVPYAAAIDGNYFKIFGKIHSKYKFPYFSLLALGTVAAAFCFLRLQDVIAALVVIRIILQFLLQHIGVMILRKRRPDMRRPFRMWLYPLPALFAAAGFVYMLISRPNFQKEIRYAAILVVVGLIIYMIRAYTRREWPFQAPPVTEGASGTVV